VSLYNRHAIVNGVVKIQSRLPMRGSRQTELTQGNKGYERDELRQSEGHLITHSASRSVRFAITYHHLFLYPTMGLALLILMFDEERESDAQLPET
jgi:hypothetical protein